MARSLNKATLIGNTGNDPDVRTTGGGNKVVNVSLATSRQWTDRDGQEQEKTEWHRLVFWGKLADVVEQYVSKGDRIYVEGAIQYGSYEDDEGVTRYTTDINVRELIMLGGRGEGQSASQGDEAPAKSSKSAAKGKPVKKAKLGKDEELPF